MQGRCASAAHLRDTGIELNPDRRPRAQLREMLLLRDALLQQNEELKQKIARGVQEIKAAKEGKAGRAKQKRRSLLSSGKGAA